jgi:hypothetical protein
LKLFDGSLSSFEDWDGGNNDGSSVSRGDFKVKWVGLYRHLGLRLQWRKKRNGTHFVMRWINQKELFDDMLFDIPRLYISACSNSVQLVPFHPILMSILFHHYKELKECMAWVEGMMRVKVEL